MTALDEAPFRLSDQPLKSELLAKYFRGFGDPTRIRILELLSKGERSINELVELLETSQSKASNHLACLRWCGFVETRREHRTVYYRVADKRVSKIIELARALLDQNEEHVAACQTIDASSPISPSVVPPLPRGLIGEPIPVVGGSKRHGDRRAGFPPRWPREVRAGRGDGPGHHEIDLPTVWTGPRGGAAKP